MIVTIFLVACCFYKVCLSPAYGFPRLCVFIFGGTLGFLQVGSALHLNANNDFTSGVVINGNGVTIQGSRMAVGTSTLEGTLRSSGSVRAASGLPTGVGPFDIGFAFDAQSQTGMFSSGIVSECVRMWLFVVFTPGGHSCNVQGEVMVSLSQCPLV